MPMRILEQGMNAYRIDGMGNELPILQDLRLPRTTLEFRLT